MDAAQRLASSNLQSDIAADLICRGLEVHVLISEASPGSMIRTLGAMVEAAGDFDELRAGRIDRWFCRASELWNVGQIALEADGS